MALKAVANLSDTSTGTNIGTTRASIPIEGNILIAFFGSANTATLSTGWTLIDSGTSTHGAAKLYSAYKIAGASESATQTPATQTSGPYFVYIYEYSGQDITSPIEQHYVQIDHANPTTSTSITPSVNNEQILYMQWYDNANTFLGLAITGLSTPAAFANPLSSTGSVAVYTKNNLTTDTTTAINYSFTGNGSATFESVFSVALKPALGNVGIVQSGLGNTPSGNPATSASVTLGAVPTNGNGLIAFVGAETTLSANTGWTLVGTANTTGANFTNMAIYRKLAGASESSTQTPATMASSAYTVIMYEVSGQATGDFTDGNAIDNGTVAAAAVATTSLTPTVFNDLWLNATTDILSGSAGVPAAGAQPTYDTTNLVLDQSEYTNGMWGFHQTVIAARNAIQYTFTDSSGDTLDTMSVLIKPFPIGITPVQSAKGNGTGTTANVTVTAPTNGNGLIAFVSSSGTIAANTGWTLVASSTAGNGTLTKNAILRKLAGASESTTQSPATISPSNAYSVIFYEVSGQAAGDFTDGNGIVNSAANAGTVTTTSLTPSVLSDLWLNATYASGELGAPTANAALTLDQSEGVNKLYGYHRTVKTSNTSTAIQYTFTGTFSTFTTSSVLLKAASKKTNVAAQMRLLGMIN